MSQPTPLTAQEMERYARHLVLPELGREGQERLKGARVLVVGVGGLGSPASLYLAAAGIGGLGLVDFDVVDRTNLHRQVLFGDADVGSAKLDAARDRLERTNPNVELIPVPVRLGRENALDILEEFDVVVDGTDSLATRYLLSDACVLLGKPYVYGAIHRLEGQISVFAVPGGPCYRCLFRRPPPAGLVSSSEEAGVLGALPGIIGTFQALETIKIVTGVGEPLVGRLQILDGSRGRWRAVRVPRDPACPACGDDASMAVPGQGEAVSGP